MNRRVVVVAGEEDGDDKTNDTPPDRVSTTARLLTLRLLLLSRRRERTRPPVADARRNINKWLIMKSEECQFDGAALCGGLIITEIHLALRNSQFLAPRDHH